MDEEKNNDINMDNENIFIINELYYILLNKKIGSGSFGQIYQCVNTETKEVYASKLESINELNPQLIHESKIMNLLKYTTGFPTCYNFYYTEQDKILIMDYLGPNLNQIMDKLPDKKFSIKSSLMIMLQCIERLRYLHEKGVIHRDIKPENFVIGRKNKERIIYLIDFGLSKKYKNQYNIHISMKKERNIIGTVKYISINTHRGLEQSRRDDLESLFYTIIYFIKGELPWKNIKFKSKAEKYNKIYEIKKKSCEKGGELCRSLPFEFQIIIDYILNLEFEEKPNYNTLKEVTELILAKLNYFNDLQFDWYNMTFLNKIMNENLFENDFSKSFIKEDENEKNNKNGIEWNKNEHYIIKRNKMNKNNSLIFNEYKKLLDSNKLFNKNISKKLNFRLNLVKNNIKNKKSSFYNSCDLKNPIPIGGYLSYEIKNKPPGNIRYKNKKIYIYK